MKLSNEEWNFLQSLTSINGMDDWFRLEDGGTEDYVIDMDDGSRMTIGDAIKDIADGLVENDLDEIPNGRAIWHDLITKTNNKED